MTRDGSSADRNCHCAPRILLVDDEQAILPEYQEFLELEGFDALTTFDPEHAVVMVAQDPEIMVVVTDLRMAKLDGIGLIRALRHRLPPERQIEFIVLTGDASSQPDLNTLGVPVLIKPADPDELVRTIRAALAS